MLDDEEVELDELDVIEYEDKVVHNIALDEIDEYEYLQILIEPQNITLDDELDYQESLDIELIDAEQRIVDDEVKPLVLEKIEYLYLDIRHLVDIILHDDVNILAEIILYIALPLVEH